MLDYIVSQTSFLLLLLFFAAGAIGSLLLKKHDSLSNIWQSFFAIAGSLWGLVFSISTFFKQQDISFGFNSSVFSLLSFSFRIDPLSAFFIFVISLVVLFCSIYGIDYIKHYYTKYSIGALGFLYHSFIAGLLMVVTSSNGIFFLIAWEIMSFASYFLVIYDWHNQDNVKAGFLYLVMTYIGTAFIIMAFLLLYQYTSSFDFEIIRNTAIYIPPHIKDIIFILGLIGFGTKAGVIPFHIWLPAAHPAAPSHVSAIMSGVMIKSGIYMMIRIFFDIFQTVPLWWGIVVLFIGLSSSLLGVLYALTEHDIKRLLAYHSIENIGIILLGLGAALIFASLGNPALSLFALGAALFHTLNHATFKSLLFLSAGSVIHQTHTRNIEEYGGLIRYMPLTAMFFLIGSMAISALPPFNGFFSEWMIFQSLLQGMMNADILVKSIFILATGALAITGGLALACFVKAFGLTFLARPRSEEVIHAKESSLALSLGMGALAILSLFFGIFSSYLGSAFIKIGSRLFMFKGFSSASVPSFSSSLIAPNAFGSVSAFAIIVIFVIVVMVISLVIKFAINRKQRIIIGTTWDCGTDLTPRMEITATGFSRSIIRIFAGILKPTYQHEIKYHDSEIRFLAKSRNVHLGLRDVYQTYFYEPLRGMTIAVSRRVNKIQSGSINMYILYILIAVVVALFLAQ
jgi:hydrogenase-4 component B